MTEAAKAGTGKGIWGALKGLVSEEVPDPVATPAAPTPPGPGARMTPLPPAPAAVAAAPVDQAALAKLEGLIEAARPAAYVAFMTKYDELEGVVTDETTRFRAALKTSHTTQAQLLDALGTMLDAADKASADFAKSLEAKKSASSAGATDLLTATQTLIASRESQLKAIQEEITTLRSKLATDTEHAQSEAARIDAIGAGFEAAHAQVVGKLNAYKNHVGSLTGA
ncbi:MAG: hypothetical protein ACHREM_00195 [Polyangiales bacterium]